MLSATFQEILEKIEVRVKVDKEILISILEYVQAKSINSYVYPELITERYKIDMNTCLKILVVLENQSILKQVYKIYCPVCRDFSEEVYESINELESYEFCEQCGKVLIEEGNPYKYVVVYFRVKKNE